MIRLVRVTVLVLVLAVIALASSVLTMHFAIHGTEVRVPNFRGMTASDARHQALGLGLDPGIENQRYSSDVAAGRIVAQSPAAGTVVRRDWHVRLVESLGPQKVEIPSVVGETERAAALDLRRLGLDLGSTSRLPIEGVAPGTVLAQDPPAHGRDVERPSVTLLVAEASTQRFHGYVMPSLAGQPLAAVAASLGRAGLRLAPPRYQSVEVPGVGGAEKPLLPVAAGTVLAQQPRPGTHIDASSTVELVVAR